MTTDTVSKETSIELGQLLDNYGRAYHNARINNNRINIVSAEFARKELFYLFLAADKRIAELEALLNKTVISGMALSMDCSPTIGDRWKLVPIEPTEKMVEAAYQYIGSGTKGYAAYKIMLAVAPSPGGNDGTD